jgi:AraC-like DNA-binding protein
VNALRNALGQTVFRAFLHDAHVASVEDPIPRSILRARQFIDEHYEEDCSLGAIAEAAAVSPQHLVYSFRKFFDTTPIRYVWRLRLAKGANLLQRSGLRPAGEGPLRLLAHRTAPAPGLPGIEHGAGADRGRAVLSPPAATHPRERRPLPAAIGYEWRVESRSGQHLEALRGALRKVPGNRRPAGRW